MFSTSCLDWCIQVKTIYPSHYGEYNATDVLLGRLKWSEVPANGEVVSDLEEVEPEEDAGAAEFKWVDWSDVDNFWRDNYNWKDFQMFENALHRQWEKGNSAGDC